MNRSTAGARERHVLDAREHGPAPGPERLLERVQGLPGLVVAHLLPGQVGQPLHLEGIDVGRVDREPEPSAVVSRAGPVLSARILSTSASRAPGGGMSAPHNPTAALSARTVSPGVSASSATRARSRLPAGVRTAPSTTTSTGPSSRTSTALSVGPPGLG